VLRRGAIIVLILIAGLVGWRVLGAIRTRQVPAASPTGPTRARAIPVQVAPASRGTITVRASYSGEVEPQARVDVFARIGGVIAEVAVREGDLVRRGQVVARLDPKELRFQVAQAVASANTQRVNVEQARASLAIQEARLRQLLAGSPPEQIRQAEEQVRQARASLEYSRQQLRRTEELYAQGFVSGQAVEAARLDVQLQEARLRSAEEQRNLLRGGPRPEEVEVARQQVRQAEVALRQAQSQLAQTQVTIRQAQNLLAESVVRAPMEGMVGRRLIDPGATVTSSTLLLQLVDVDPVLITIPVPEQETSFVRPGVAATVSADAVPGQTFHGRVSSVSPLLAEATRTAEVRIQVANPGRVLRPGMTARVGLVLINRADVVTVSVDAVVEEEGRKRLFVVQQEVARQREVITGATDGQRVEIRSGVAAGELVVVAGQLNLRDGAAVVVRGSDGAAPGGPPGQRRRPAPGGDSPARTPTPAGPVTPTPAGTNP
jgi:RND family efflux transporter MFP subunit